MDALRISPNYDSRAWQALDLGDSDDWVKATAIVRDRLEGRFLRFASLCLEYEYSGFVVLSIDCLLAETVQQFSEGITDGRYQSKELIKRFLEGGRFQPDFDAAAREAFYKDIRCGLLHQAEAKGMWLVRRNQPSLLHKTIRGNAYIIDVKRFHAAVQGSLDDYLSLVTEPASAGVRANLWQKMNHICRVREAWGVLYETDVESSVTQSITRHAPDESTDAINRAVDEIGDQADEFVAAAARRVLDKTEW